MPNVDRKVSNLNQDAFKALQQIKNPQNMSKDEAKALRSAILKDGKIDETEKDLLLEISQNESTQIKVSSQKSPGFNPSDLNFGTVKGEAKEIIETLTKPQDLNKLWDGGPEGWRKLMDLYDSAPVTKDHITKFTANKLYQAWNQSTLGNGYAPVRGLIAQAYTAIKGADPQTTTNGRNLLYDSMKTIDQKTRDSVPDFLYNWLKAPAN